MTRVIPSLNGYIVKNRITCSDFSAFFKALKGKAENQLHTLEKGQNSDFSAFRIARAF